MQDTITDFLQWTAGRVFYGIGRTFTRLFGRVRSATGWPETFLGFAILAIAIFVVVSIVKLPVRVASLAILR